MTEKEEQMETPHSNGQVAAATSSDVKLWSSFMYSVNVIRQAYYIPSFTQSISVLFTSETQKPMFPPQSILLSITATGREGPELV